MNNKILNLLFIAFVLVLSSSCTTINRTMVEPSTKVNFTKSDFSLSEQVSAEARTVKVLGIDWSRFFVKRSGEVIAGGSLGINLASIPVIGNFIFDKTANYALYELMLKNPGYDVVFYPQYETRVLRPVLGLGFLSKITTVKTTARLAKLNK